MIYGYFPAPPKRTKQEWNAYYKELGKIAEQKRSEVPQEVMDIVLKYGLRIYFCPWTLSHTEYYLRKDLRVGIQKEFNNEWKVIGNTIDDGEYITRLFGFEETTFKTLEEAAIFCVGVNFEN